MEYLGVMGLAIGVINIAYIVKMKIDAINSNKVVETNHALLKSLLEAMTSIKSFRNDIPDDWQESLEDRRWW
jgi:hypothetical protein